MLTTAGTDVTALVRQMLGDPRAEIAERREEPIGHPLALSTAGLHRVSGTTTEGRPWSFVVKAIRSAKHFPMIGTLPASFREMLLADFPWRGDADVYLSDPPLPGGLRLPRLYRLDDLGDERLVMWLEDVEVDPAASWDLARYRAAARLLGALAAMRPAPHQDPPDRGLRLFCSGPAAHIMIPALRDPDTWRHPLVAAHADPLLRTDLLALADRIPELLDAVAGLPHTLPHGDASPQNLLVPRDGSAEFVAIDWNWTGSSVIGSDLAQLLAGLPQAGQTEPADLPAVHEAIESAYTEAAGADPAHVSLGYAATLVLRCAWTALPLDRLGEKPTPELEDLFRRRAGLARFIADIGRSLRL